MASRNQLAFEFPANLTSTLKNYHVTLLKYSPFCVAWDSLEERHCSTHRSRVTSFTYCTSHFKVRGNLQISVLYFINQHPFMAELYVLGNVQGSGRFTFCLSAPACLWIYVDDDRNLLTVSFIFGRQSQRSLSKKYIVFSTFKYFHFHMLTQFA